MKRYNRTEVFTETLKYFNGDELATNTWINKYCLKDSDGNFYELTPDDMHRRLAKELARIELKYPNPLSENEIYELLKDFKYIIPGGSPMSGIGNDMQVSSISNCFVVGNEYDSYGGIIRTDEEQIQLMKRRGGVGHDLSHIRPKGSPVKNSALTSTGVVPFMERFSNTTREVAQDGRRGALMLSISVKHPDSESFIDAKLTDGKVTGANISVKLTDEFMNAAKNDLPFKQQYPINGENVKISKEIDSKKLWNKIIHNAWKSAEPGVLFWDTIQKESVPDCYAEYGFKSVSTNPCGEIPLCPYDSCRLLAVNLFSYVKNPFTKDAFFDIDLFEKHAQIALRLMDDIVDLELEKIDKILEKVESDGESDDIKSVELNVWNNIKEMTLKGRRTGLGITSEGDMLAALGHIYGSESALTFSTQTHALYAKNAFISSVILASERGAFEVWDYELEKNNPFIKRVLELLPESIINMYKKTGKRNIAMLTIAPTGCLELNTIIKTDRGEISLKNLLELYTDINVESLYGLNNIWFDLNEQINVFDIYGGTHKISKIYWNGFAETRKITFINNDIVEQTLNHKYLVKLNDNSAIWKSVDELKIGDKIIKLK